MARNENTFWTTFWWMGKHLNLSGTEKEIYAIIYGFTQDGNHWFHGKRSYLVDCTNASLSTVTRCLATLVEKGLIEKYAETDDMMQTTVQYRVCLDKIPRFQNDTTLCQNDTGSSFKMTHINNILNNKKNKKEKPIKNIDKEYNNESVLPINDTEDVFSKKSKSSDKKDQCLDMIEKEIENERLQEVLKDYFPIWYDAIISDPEKRRKTNIVSAWKGLVINKLKNGLVEKEGEEPCSVDEQIQAVYNAMKGGKTGPYTSVYRPKTYQKFSQQKSNISKGFNQSMTNEELEEYRKQQEEWRNEMEQKGIQIKF